jgi:hypothetical protein
MGIKATETNPVNTVSQATLEWIFEKIGHKPEDLAVGTRIYESKCEVCGQHFGYLVVPPNNYVLADNVIVLDGYEKPKALDHIKCLHCGTLYRHAKDLFSHLIYTKEGK